MKHKLAVKGISDETTGKFIKRSVNNDHRPGIWETVGGGVEVGLNKYIS